MNTATLAAIGNDVKVWWANEVPRWLKVTTVTSWSALALSLVPAAVDAITITPMPVIHAGVDTAVRVTLSDGTETYLQTEYLECQDDPTILVFEDFSATCMTLDPHQHLRILANRSAFVRNAK